MKAPGFGWGPLSYNNCMDDIMFRSGFTVDLVNHCGDDDAVLAAMLVSTLRDTNVENLSETDKFGKINFLMRDKHGTPFEHNAMIFRVEAPIFVYREWHRHRIGISINEQSGRYTEFKPVFYIPGPDRKLKQIGKPGHYQYVEGDSALYDWLVEDMKEDSVQQFARYKRRLEKGVAKEVARMSLGVNIYSSMYWTCNARSLMAFLGLRTLREAWNPLLTAEENARRAKFPSTPMWEIAACADVLEQIFSTLFPLTHKAFETHGRVAP